MEHARTVLTGLVCLSFVGAKDCARTPPAGLNYAAIAGEHCELRTDEDRDYIEDICIAYDVCDGLDGTTIGTVMACETGCVHAICPEYWAACKTPGDSGGDCGQCTDIMSTIFWVGLTQARGKCSQVLPLRPEVNQCMIDEMAKFCPGLSAFEWWHTPHPYPEMAAAGQWLLNWPKVD